MKERCSRVKDTLKQLYFVLYGYHVYRRIKRYYGKNCRIYVGQHPGTGDVYLQAMLLDSYAKAQSVECYVFTVIGGAAKSVADLFQIQNVCKLSLFESDCLVDFYRFYGSDCGIEVIHYHPRRMYYGILGYLRNCDHLSFSHMMKEFVFNCKEQPLRAQSACFQKDTSVVEQIFEERHFVKGKTVLLIPYANSLNNLPIQFWETLTKRLNDKGYTVCTNSSGSGEPPVRGSCPIYIPYKQLEPFLKMAGYSISFRCGLSDILSNIEHTKIILYPKQEIYSIMGGISTVYDYFSLKNMGLSNDAIEYEIDLSKKSELIKVEQKILKQFQ